MKKLTALLMTLCIMAGFCACGTEDQVSTAPTTGNHTTEASRNTDTDVTTPDSTEEAATPSEVTEPFSESLEYTLSGDTYCVSSIGSCTDSVVIIPELYNGLPVTAISEDVFRNNASITEITIPGTVKTIEHYAFENCTALSKVTLGKGVRTIGGAAFQGCTALTEISLPESLSYIQYSAFKYCTSLKNVSMVGVLEIGETAFAGCTALEEITIPGTASTLGNGIFSGCSALSSIVLSEGIETIGYSAFENCGLTSLTVPSTVKKLGNNCFSGCRNLGEIHFNGTMAQWKSIKKGNGMYLDCGTTGAICTDGSTAY